MSELMGVLVATNVRSVLIDSTVSNYFTFLT